MINLTNKLVVLRKGNKLAKDIEASIEETWRLLEVTYAQGRRVDPKQINASGRNQVKALAFIRYVPPYKDYYDCNWLCELYEVIQKVSVGDVRKHDPKMFAGLIEQFPKCLMSDVIRGLKVFFLALWKRKSILLTMTFSLPESKRKREFAERFYSEVLYCFRTVKMKSIKRADLDISKYMSHSAIKNFQWYPWRAVVASDWHKIEDINNKDLIKLFEEMKSRKISGNKDNGPWYPLSPPAMLNPLVVKFGDRCQFALDEVSKYNPRIYQDPKALSHEIGSSDRKGMYDDIKSVWLKFEELYLDLLKKTQKKKSTSNDEQDLGWLNSYLFSVLPVSNEVPPSPKEFNRAYIDGLGVPSLREHISRRDRMTSIERFFNYLEELSDLYPELEGFKNPIIQLDKPLEAKRRVTNKVPFGVDDFRLLYDMVYAICEFSYYINSHIADVSSPNHKKFIDILVKKSSSGIISAEEFGYIPFVSFKRLRDDRDLMVCLKYIPSPVLKIISVKIKGVDGYVPFLSIQAVNQTAVALETGLRHISIRWLDKRTYKHGVVDRSKDFFNLYVNTDKSNGPWVRPTSTKLLDIFEKQVESQEWIDSNHFDDELYYDGHEESVFGKIKPIFMRYDEPDVYSQLVYSGYYRNLMYYFSMIKLMIGEDPADDLPEEVYGLSFDSMESFKKAVRFRTEFRSQFTPHGTRASVVSVLSSVLPADMIGQYVTGHVSVDHVKYYTVVTAELMESMGLITSADSKSRAEEIISMITPISIRADSPDSALRKALEDPSIGVGQIAEEFGAISFTSDNGKEIVSGMSEIHSVDRRKLSIMPTHICPFENQCPEDVKSTIGEKSCGQCPYSIKTVDHLTRIQAHCRYMARKLDALKATMRSSAQKGATNEQLDIYQEQYSKLAAELSAWILTERILRENYESLRKKALVNKPDMLKIALNEKEVEEDWLTKLMLACEEAVSFPDIADATLESQVLRCKVRLMTAKKGLSDFYLNDNSYNLIDGFRADMRAVCMQTGLTPKQLAHHIDNVDPIAIHENANSNLLESIN